MMFWLTSILKIHILGGVGPRDSPARMSCARNPYSLFMTARPPATYGGGVQKLEAQNVPRRRFSVSLQPPSLEVWPGDTPGD